MATFNSTDLGLVEEMSTSAAPKDLQANAYPGVDGLEILDMGARGGSTRVRGSLAGTSAADLASIHATLRGYQVAGGLATLVDANGVSWTDVILVMFQPVGPRFSLGPLGVAQRYEAEFLHVS